MRNCPLLLVLAGCLACTSRPTTSNEDAGTTAPPRDSGVVDAAISDAAMPDAPIADAAVPDAGFDAGSLVVDAGQDAGITVSDAGAGDAAVVTTDAGPPDAAAPTCPEAVSAVTPSTVASWTDGTRVGTATLVGGTPCARSWQISTTATLRDNQPANPRAVADPPSGPSLHTTNTLLDALYALALQDAEYSHVASVSDAAFNTGHPVACPLGGCFESGRLWTWVWTRDISFSLDLALAQLDPTRARNSLEFKLSLRRGGTGEEVVQDTGSGGSWPVSTDRVVWALGARELLLHLDATPRGVFLDRAITAMRNTVERDRLVAHDGVSGLYRGESTFLDWREQTYPAWVAQDPVHVANARSLSTNLLHLHALGALSEWLTERGDATGAARYAGWATDLRNAVRAAFLLPGGNAFGAFLTTTLDPAPVQRRDLLAEALAILLDVADTTEAGALLSTYPHLARGVPVIWPQQKDTPIYHNRAMWPFVTAYWMRAARKVSHDTVVTHGVRSLVRAAALNLTNMENLEIVTGDAYLADGAYSGPVVNSQRQLWSVAGYLAMVQEVLFGVEYSSAGITVRPFIPRAVREELFPDASTITLDGIRWHGKLFSVVVDFPAGDTGTEGAYGVGAVTLNGDAVAGPMALASLQPTNMVRVTLSAAGTATRSMRVITDTTDYRDLFGPRAPIITSVSSTSGGLSLALDPSGETPAEVTWNIYRDGARVASALPGSTTAWVDLSPPVTRAPCYTSELVFLRGGNASQHAAPVCFWGTSNERIQAFAAAALANVGGTRATTYGRDHWDGWGEPSHTLTLAWFTSTVTGPHLVHVVVGNGAGPIGTGITCGVKHLRVLRVSDGAVAGEGYLVMPQLGTWNAWKDSSYVRAELQPATAYSVVIDQDTASVNMSSFQHYALYSGGTGGSVAFNRVNIAEVKVLAVGN